MPKIRDHIRNTQSDWHKAISLPHAPEPNSTEVCETSPIVPLEKSEVDRRSLTPSKDFVREIASRIVRGGSLERPGYAFIPDTRELLRTRERSCQFTENLMVAIRKELIRSCPEALLPPPLSEGINHSLTVAQATSVMSAEFSSRHSVQFHFDQIGHLYVAINYGQHRNLKGGKPIVLDLLQLAQNEGEEIGADAYITYSRNPSYLDREFPTAYTVFADLIDDLEVDYQSVQTVLTEYNSSRFPVLLFTNRIEDGISHGATRPSRKSLDSPTSRRLFYSAIRVDPTARIKPLKDPEGIRTRRK